MKKLFIAALAAFAMVACVNEEEVISVKGGDAIEFADAFLDNATRAAVDPSITTNNIDGFNVWAFMDSVEGTIFEGEEVTKSGSDWTYVNTQYWSPSHTYYFGALAPMNSANWTLAPATDTAAGMLGLGKVTFTNVDGGEDIIYAKDVVTTAADINAQPGAVKFQFQHLLSKVKFTIQNGFTNDNAKLVIKDIKMTAPAAGTIDLAVADYSKGWVLDGNKPYAYGDLEAEIGRGAKAESANERMTIPAAADYKYVITFTVELYMGDVLAQTFDETTELSGIEFEMGKAYNLTAELNATNVGVGLYPITFEVEVDEWVSAGDYDLDPTTAIVTNDTELAAAINNTSVENILMKAGNYTLAKYRAGAKLIGVENGVVIDVQGKKFGVNGDVYAENVELVFSNANYTGFQHTATSYYKNCTITGQPFLYGNDTTFEDCVFNQTSANAYNVWTYGAKSVEFINCEFNSAGKAVLIYTESGNGQTVTFTNCELNASAPATGKAAIEVDSSLIAGEYIVNINGTTANGFDAGSVSGSTLYNNKKGTKATITVDGVEVVKAGYNYINSAEALAAALTANKADIKVILNTNIDCAISLLGSQTPGSGEYKLGGDTTNSILIDLNGKKLNITTTYWSNLGAKNDSALFTIKNGTMTSSQATGTWNSYDLTFSNCNYVIEDVVFEKAVAFANEGKQVDMKNVTINETHDYYAMWITAEGQTVNAENLTINNANGRGIKIDEQYVSAPSKVTLNIKDSKVTSNKKAAILVKSVAGAEINVDNLDITAVAADTEFAVWVDEDSADYAHLVVVNGAYCKVEGQTVVFAADAAALQSALDAAAGNVEIRLTGDIAGDITATQNDGANITIDGQGKKVQGTIYLNGQSSTGTDKALTIKNVNFETTDFTRDFISCATDAVRYARNITIEDCTFKGAGNTSEVVVLRLRQCYDVVVKNCTATDIHSFAQNTSSVGQTYENVTVNGGRGFNFMTSAADTHFYNCDITATKADGYGIRFDAGNANDASVNDTTINAYEPIVLRKGVAAFVLNVNGCTLNATGAQDIVVAGTPTVYVDGAAL